MLEFRKWKKFFVKGDVYYVNNPMELFYGAMFFSEIDLMVRYESFTFYNRCDLLYKKQLHYFVRDRKSANRTMALDIIRAFASFKNHLYFNEFPL